MKSKGRYLSIVLAIVAVFVVSLAGMVGTSDEVTQNLETRVLENFDDNPTEHWVAKGSKFAARETDETGKEIVYPRTMAVKTFPRALFGYQTKDETKQVLGVNVKFIRKGYNYVEIMPVKPRTAADTDKDVVYKDGSGNEFVANPMSIPGRVKNFDVWVWGSNYNYYLEAYFEDSWGIPHVVGLGDLRFTGWKNLSVELPASISQSTHYIPRYKPLVFTKFVLWTRPTERVDGYYIYFDQIKVLTDIFESGFDGDDLANPEKSDEIWKK